MSHSSLCDLVPLFSFLGVPKIHETKLFTPKFIRTKDTYKITLVSFVFWFITIDYKTGF